MIAILESYWSKKPDRVRSTRVVEIVVSVIAEETLRFRSPFSRSVAFLLATPPPLTCPNLSQVTVSTDMS